TYSTNATAYAPTGTGACGFPAGSDPSLTAAINSSSPNDYQAGLVCGACAAVLDTATSKSITLMIDNSCGTCTFPEQLDLTQATWQALTGNTSYGVLPIQWGFVPCPASLMAGDASSQITYQWSQCNNAFYTPIQFMDNLFPITAVAWATSSTGPFTALALDPNKGGNNYWANGGENLNSTTGPFYFNIT